MSVPSLGSMALVTRFPGKHCPGTTLRAICERFDDYQPLSPQRSQYFLQEINDALGLFGVEHIPAGSNRKSPAIYYVNTGDSYGTTIMVVGGRIRVGNWGDIVERGNYA